MAYKNSKLMDKAHKPVVGKTASAKKPKGGLKKAYGKKK
jgi:hypothetical protein